MQVTEEICNKWLKQSRGRMNKQNIMDTHYNSISYQITQHNPITGGNLFVGVGVSDSNNQL